MAKQIARQNNLASQLQQRHHRDQDAARQEKIKYLMKLQSDIKEQQLKLEKLKQERQNPRSGGAAAIKTS